MVQFFSGFCSELSATSVPTGRLSEVEHFRALLCIAQRFQDHVRISFRLLLLRWTYTYTLHQRMT